MAGTRRRQATICFPFGTDPEPLDTAPGYRRRPYQVFFTNDFEHDQMVAWCQRACGAAYRFFVKARVVFYETGAARIQEEHYYAEFDAHHDAVAFSLRWAD